MTTLGVGNYPLRLLPTEMVRSGPLSPTAHRHGESASELRPPPHEPNAGASSPFGVGRPDDSTLPTPAGKAAAKEPAVPTARRLVAAASANERAQPEHGSEYARDRASGEVAGAGAGAPLQAQSSDTLQRTRRTPPPLPLPPEATFPATEHTFDIYNGPATRHNGLSSSVLSQAAGQPGKLNNVCAGLVLGTLYLVAAGKAPNLFEMTSVMRDSLGDPQLRQTAIDSIYQVQRDTVRDPIGNVPGFIARPNFDSIRTSAELRKTLESEFGQRHSSADGRGSYQTTMMPIRIQFRAAPASEQRPDGGSVERPGHMIIVQRLDPSDNFRNDRYQIYDPQFGAFEYENFDQMAVVMARLLDYGYQQYGFIARVRTLPYDAENTYRPNDGASAAASSLGNATLASLDDMPELQGAHALSLPPVNLPRPDFTQLPRPPHDELKRDVSAAADPQPYVLYRPSDVPPEAMRKAHGFSAENTRMNNVNLVLHNDALSLSPGATDGGGYLGTFRDSETAKKRLSGGGQQSGYIYYIKPSPNMVDVHGSLGKADRIPGDREVAAMGRIDDAQVCGWSKVEAGVVGPFVANPDYRYDIFDHTRTSGAQPQLAHFLPDDPAWADSDHEPFVSVVNIGGKVRYLPNEDPALTSAAFYRRALDKIHYAVSQMEKGEDYREPVHIKPYFNNNDGKGGTKLNFHNGNGYPAVDFSDSGLSQYEFSFGDDGRIHSAHDYGQVLRIDKDGNAYIGSAPKDPTDLNGVFVYVRGVDGLLHVEDRKWLTEGVFAVTPYVSPPQSRDGQLAARQSWRLENAERQAVFPPLPMAAFVGNPVATSEQQYRLYLDPDSALPRGATHFVTEVPSADNPHRGQALVESQPSLRQDEAARISAWLKSHNAAWLFRDGLMAISAAHGQLEIRTIGGTPVWRTRADPAGSHVLYDSLQASSLKSTFKLPEPVWNRIIAQQSRYAELEGRAQHFYM